MYHFGTNIKKESNWNSECMTVIISNEFAGLMHRPDKTLTVWLRFGDFMGEWRMNHSFDSSKLFFIFPMYIWVYLPHGFIPPVTEVATENRGKLGEKQHAIKR